MPGDPVKVEVFLDNDPEPIATFRPPGTFELDRTKMEDGPHRLRIHAIDRSGVPELRGDPVVLNPDATEQIRTVLGGLHEKEIGGVTYASEMPSFGDQLDDQHIAAVINHTRTSWGNRAPTVTPADVAKIRAEVH